MTDAYDPTCVLNMPGFYPFSDGATRKVRDFSSYGYHGTETNFPGTDIEYVDNFGKQSLLLDGTNKYLNCGNAAQCNFGISNFCMEVWFATSNVAAQRCAAAKYDVVTNTGYLLICSNSLNPYIGFYVYNNGNFRGIRVTTALFSDGNLHHVIGKRLDTEVYLYVDGVTPAISRAGVAALYNVSTTSDLIIGARADASSNYFGYIRSVSFFNRNLGDSEIYDRFCKGMQNLI